MGTVRPPFTALMYLAGEPVAQAGYPVEPMPRYEDLWRRIAGGELGWLRPDPGTETELLHYLNTAGHWTVYEEVVGYLPCTRLLWVHSDTPGFDGEWILAAERPAR